jgi:hypothetical protein
MRFRTKLRAFLFAKIPTHIVWNISATERQGVSPMKVTETQSIASLTRRIADQPEQRRALYLSMLTLAQAIDDPDKRAAALKRISLRVTRAEHMAMRRPMTRTLDVDAQRHEAAQETYLSAVHTLPIRLRDLTLQHWVQSVCEGVATTAWYEGETATVRSIAEELRTRGHAHR